MAAVYGVGFSQFGGNEMDKKRKQCGGDPGKIFPEMELKAED